MKKNDLILIGSVLVVALLFFIGYRVIYHKDGSYVIVTVDGMQKASFPLSGDTTYTIKGANHGTNLLVIKNGSALIREANCPDNLCVKQKSIKKEGETLVCLPHKVIVSISSSDPSDHSELDGVAN